MRTESYEPYKLDSLKALMQKAFRMGWYPGKQDLLKVTMQGAFEGWSGRSTENWEHHFLVEFRKPAGDNAKTHPELVYTAEGGDGRRSLPKDTKADCQGSGTRMKSKVQYLSDPRSGLKPLFCCV